jgi:hypothetical protein
MNTASLLAIGLTLAIIGLIIGAYAYPAYSLYLTGTASVIAVGAGYFMYYYSSKLADYKQFEESMVQVKESILQVLQNVNQALAGTPQAQNIEDVISLLNELLTLEVALLSELQSTKQTKEELARILNKAVSLTKQGKS